VALTVKELSGAVEARTGDIVVRGVVEGDDGVHPFHYAVSASDPLSVHEEELVRYESKLAARKERMLNHYSGLAGSDLSTSEVEVEIAGCHVVIEGPYHFKMRVNWVEKADGVTHVRQIEVKAVHPANLPTGEAVLALVAAAVAKRYPALPAQGGDQPSQFGGTAVAAHLAAIRGMVG